MATPDEKPPARILQLARLHFRQNCERCHGTDGTGDRVRARLPAIPDFTRPSWQATRSDLALQVSILEGSGDGMPGFDGKVSTRQARQLVALIRSFSYGPRRPMQMRQEDFDRRFQELEEELIRLELQFKALCPRTHR